MNGDSNDALPIVMIVGAALGLLVLMWPRKPKAKPVQPTPDRPPRQPYMTREQWKLSGILIVALVAIVSVWAASQDQEEDGPRFYQGGPSEGAFASTDPYGRPGKAEVYARIDNSTDCADLQATFDRHIDDALSREPNTYIRNVVTGYAEAADNRMHAIGCFG